jgi:prephenate dehydrogenase
MQKILIVGLGLIGGSFAKALKSKLNETKIYFYDIDKNLQNDNFLEGFCDISKKMPNFDLIVIASFLSSYEEIWSNLTKNCQNLPLIIDLGSLKEIVIEKAPKKFLSNFIACHPIAGKEKSGFENSEAELFVGKKFIICKNSQNNEQNLQKIFDLAKLIGAVPEFMDAKKHDEIYALMSHLPQFISFLTIEFSPPPEKIKNERIFRLNYSNPELWSDIFRLNAKNIEKLYVEFFENLMDFAQKIDDEEFNEIVLEVNSSKASSEVEKSAETIFRFLVICAFLKIKKIDEFQKYAGSGFEDFTLIKFLLKLDIDDLKNHRIKLLEFFDKISYDG